MTHIIKDNLLAISTVTMIIILILFLAGYLKKKKHECTVLCDNIEWGLTAYEGQEIVTDEHIPLFFYKKLIKADKAAYDKTTHHRVHDAAQKWKTTFPLTYLAWEKSHPDRIKYINTL